MSLLQVVPTSPTDQINGWAALVIIMPVILALVASTIAALLGYINGKKTDGVHVLLNSQLSQFKEESAKSYSESLRSSLALAKSEYDRESAATASHFETRIAKLEADLRLQSDQLMDALRAMPPPQGSPVPVSLDAVAPAVVAQIAPLGPITPPQRLEEIRGQQ